MSKAKYDKPTAKDLLDAGVHFGHQVRRWHPSMEKYIYTVRNETHIIDLEQTEELLAKACDFLFDTAATGGQIIIVGTKRQAKDMVALEAKRSGALFVNERWLGGTITNLDVIKKNIKKFLDYLKRREAGELSMYTKKERLLIDREIEKLDRYVGGISSLSGVPSALFIIDARREKTAIREAKKAGVPVVALIDTNTNPEGIDHIIPGNDDGIKSVSLILKAVADAIEAGYKKYAEDLEKGKVEAAEKKAKESAKESSDKSAETKADASTVKTSTSESKTATKDAGKKAVKEATIEDASEKKSSKKEGSDDSAATAKEATEAKAAKSKPAKKEEK